MSGGQGARRSLARQDWLDAAQNSLIESGINSVKIEVLATKLAATRGSFYWHFADHSDLLVQLLAVWVETNTQPFRRVLDADGDQPLTQALRYAEVWLHNKFDPAFDAAVRDWGRTSETVATTVRRIDEERLDILVNIFERIGYGNREALVRARAFYYHQVGYYALKVVQPEEERFDLFPIYFRVLTGCPIPPGAAARLGPI